MSGPDDNHPRPATFTCFECREVVPSGKLEAHLRDAHRLSIYGEPLPMAWWKAVLAMALIVGTVVVFGGRC